MKPYINRESQRKSWQRSRWFFVLTFILLILISASLIRELIRSQNINKEIDELEARVVSLQNENEEIEDFVEYLKTDAYFEEQARLKLGLKANGEKVIVLTEENSTKINPSTNSVGVDSPQIKNHSNMYRWFAYFFGGA